ncbi:hypothetical protein F5882DRAFT_434625 [Hyaloscypha sp. PMI_1271]|nr:hypothetical protein F5882DRAFT_434625 [Hyaloscypha sp. PMI_1271]
MEMQAWMSLRALSHLLNWYPDSRNVLSLVIMCAQVDLVVALPPTIVYPPAAVRSNLKLAVAQAAMPLAQPAVPAMPALVPTTAYQGNAVLKTRKPVEGRDVGNQALFAALAVVLVYVAVEKNAVQAAVCPPVRGIRVVGKSIAHPGNSVALDRPDVVLMNGNAVEIRAVLQARSVLRERVSSKTQSTPKLPTASSASVSTTKSCVTAGPSPTGAAIKNLPVIEFIYIDTEFEPFGDIVKSMCLGMKNRNVVGNQDILTYAGSKDPCYKDRRSEAKCGGCCTNLLKDSGPFKGFPTSCDEYPFASTVEGGTGAHKSCVVGFQNSLQGGKLGPFLSKLTYGEQFVVRIVGINCATVQESDLQGCVNGASKLKRQDNGGQSDSGFTDQVRALDSISSSKAAIMPLPDGGGLYSVNLRLQSGEVHSVSVYSNAGAQLDDGSVSISSISTTGSSFDFDLDYEEYGVGVFAYTNQNSINVSYSVSVTPNTASATSSGETSTSTSNKSSAAMLTSSSWLWFCCYAIIWGFHLRW